MILVTGGAGYIGSALVDKLIELKKKVIVVDDLSQGKKKYIHPQAKFYKIDITKKTKLAKVFSENKITTVFHLAAKKAVGESEEKPFFYLENNVVGTINLLEAMANHQCSKIILSSTACVYQEKAKGVYQETDLLSAYNHYGYTKVENEQLIQELARLKKVNYVIFRYFNVCGDMGLFYQEEKAKNIFPVLAQAIREDKPFKVFGKNYPTPDGSGVRDYIHLTDLIDAHLKGLTVKKNQVYNLGTKKGTSVLEIIQEFEKQLKRKIKYKVVARRKGDLAICLANSQKAQKELNWRAKENLATMVSDFITTYKLK